MSWSSLSQELRLIVFNFLASDKSRPYASPSAHKEARRKRTGSTRGEQATYAAVDREWQAYFENRNFERLIIHQSDIQEFGRFIVQPGRAVLVRWIWLRVELPGYCCDRCNRQESVYEKGEHEFILTWSLRDLLGHVSGFPDDHPGITLELSIQSPSESKHWYKSLRHTMNDTAWYSSETDLLEPYPDDKTHGYNINFATSQEFRPGPYFRVFGDPHGLKIYPKSAGIPPRKTLPKARAVRELVIRIQCHRRLSIRKGLLPIIRSLPGLESLTYECRRAWVNAIREPQHHDLFSRVVASCQTLRNLSVHEANN